MDELSHKRSVAGLMTPFIFSEAERAKICWTNYPLCEAHRDIPSMRDHEKFQKRSA